jgi:DNA-binding response OmpR family regulator
MGSVVLVVDDSLTVRMDLIEAFVAEGMQAIGCETLAAARMALAQQPVGLVILDVVLPDGSGVDLLKEIRALAATAELPILMLSSEAEVRDRIRGLATGSNDYVGKPYDRDYVLARARELLRQGNGAGSTQRPTVLVIDDSVTFREELCHALEEHGYQPLPVTSGEEGLRAAATHRPTAVVVDGVLPGIDGATVVRKLRLDVALRHTPCVLLTGSTTDLSAELAALDAGADSFVRKEEDMSVILARVGAALRAARSTKSLRDTASLLGPKKILAVDDSPTYLDALTSTLGGEGFDVITARSGEDALEMLGVQSVDCILLDLVMPGLSGTETCRRIKASPATRDISLIMLTASDDRTAMISSLGVGADDYVLKSSEPEVLKARLRAQLRRKQFEDEGRQLRLQLLRKELEATEVRAAQELAAAKAVAVEQLERKNQELELATNAKSQFLSTMSHEIRTPMNAIIGMAGLLNDTRLTDQQREYAAIIRSSGEHLLTIINDILDFSALESDKLKLEDAPFKVVGVIEDSLDLVAERARQKNLELVHEVPDDVPEVVLGDIGRVRQILLNYLSNAVKFTARGEILVSVRSVPKDQGKHELHFAVRDTGMGIPAERFDRLFHSFSQVDASTQRQFGGTGLGLAICKRLAELMGGRVWVESRLDHGSTFHFSVLVGVPANAAGGSGRTSFASSLKGLQAWVVDDNLPSRNHLQRRLEEWGMQVRGSASPEEALLWGRTGSPCNLVILDASLPRMSGVQLAEALQQLRGGALKQILLDSSAVPRDAQRLSAIGATTLSKPVRGSTLFNAIVELLGQRVSSDSLAATGSHKIPDLAATNPLRILVAEDNPVNVKLITILLQRMGYRADVAGNGNEAVEALRRQPYDVILMDMQMPQMDGIGATRIICREWPPEKRPRIIALTAAVLPEERQACQDAGMNEFLVKPIDRKLLAEALAQCKPLTDADEGPS